MKTILHVITGLERGGAETVLLRMVLALRKYRHVVLSLGTRGVLAASLEQAGSRVEALKLRRPTGLIEAPGRLSNILRRTRPDLIQSWLVHANVASALAHRALSPAAPLVWNVRQSLQALDKEKWLTQKVISVSSHVAHLPAAIVYNSSHAALQHERMGYPHVKREVIPNGFDTRKFSPRPDLHERVRGELGIERDAIIVGLVGRFHPVKNHAAFFEAATQVLSIESRAFFLLAGTGTETERMLPFIKDNVLRDRLIGLGDRQDINRITSVLDIACNVSHSEAFSNVVGEAMACGVPCIVTPVGESPSIVGDTGLVTSDTSGPSIARALVQMMELGQDARAELGRRARERIESKYSLPSVVARYEHLYDRLMGGPILTPAPVSSSAG